MSSNFNPRDFKGSRLRCLQLTSLHDDIVADFLTKLVEPHAQVSADGGWKPRGMLSPAEVELGVSPDFLSGSQREELLKWWLKVSATVPNWDIVANCTVDGTPGLLLVEAKAHPTELKEKDSSGATGENRAQIEGALAEAERQLNSLLPGWKLSAGSHYQLSNRFAWAWKVASMGVPVVLVYLGFLDATEMLTDSRQILSSPEEWEARVREYSKDAVPPAAWNGALSVNGTPLITLIRSAKVTVTAEVVGVST